MVKGVFPISTGVVVSALAQPQWLMEIDVTAVILTTGRGGGRMTLSISALLPGIRSAGHCD
jgi:hypothetical protein